MGPLLATGGRFPRRAAALVLLLAAVVLTGAAVLRSTEHDEIYSIFVTGGIARPEWPSTVFTPAEAEEPFRVHTDATDTARLLRDTDVHPPLYFWALGAWRGVAGDGLLALRGLSILFALAAIGTWMAAAWRAGLPPVAVGLATTLAYGFGYTGHIARGFALAHLLLALLALAALEVWRRGRPGRRTGTAVAATAGSDPGRIASDRMPADRATLAWAAFAGLAAGLACFTNYLAVFPAAAVLAWMALLAPPPDWGRRLRITLAAGLPFLLPLGGALYFYLAQKDSRTGQFDPFSPLPALLRLARFNAANLFGGLPLYVEGAAAIAVSAALAALLVLAVLLVIGAWRRLGPTRWLWAGGALAPSAGLLALGVVFGNTPVELRYVAFSAPFAAALIAGAAAAWARRAPRAAKAGLGLVLGVQAAGTLGMALHPSTQQPFRDALAALAPRLGADSVLVVPFADDGVGVTGSLLLEAPPDQKMLVLRLADAAGVPDRAAGFRRVVLIGLGDRDGAKQARSASAALRADPSWRSLGVAWSDFRGGFAEVFERGASAEQPPVVAGGR
jgi:hypothetical protein